MRFIEVRNNELWLGGHSVRDLVLKYGSPLYVYQESVIRNRYKTLYQAIPYPKKRIHYAMKANSNLHILDILKKEGCCIDAVSREEVMIALEAGFAPNKILFTGINLTLEDMQFAVKNKIMLNIGSLFQLEFYGEHFPGTEISIRINPDFGAGHHDHCVTGGRDSKFGIFYTGGSKCDLDEVPALIKKYNLTLSGIHSHIGSGILEEEKFIELIQVILNLAKRFPNLDFIDFGGGIGIPYRPEEKDFDLAAFGEHLSNVIQDFNKEYGKEVTIALEPGRFIVAESGILLTTITDLKKTPKYTFAGVDSGFNHLIRPMAYGSYHPILNASNIEDEKEDVLISGYLCESGDLFTRSEEGPEVRSLSKPEVGNILALLNSGAYGFSMSSNYNSRPRPAEVLITNGSHRIIRRRETLADLLKTNI